eukprot:scaffold2804_cov371-Prasinococcus_capsulatus_cf.AAC.21
MGWLGGLGPGAGAGKSGAGICPPPFRSRRGRAARGGRSPGLFFSCDFLGWCPLPPLPPAVVIPAPVELPTGSDSEAKGRASRLCH